MLFDLLWFPFHFDFSLFAFLVAFLLVGRIRSVRSTYLGFVMSNFTREFGFSLELSGLLKLYPFAMFRLLPFCVCFELGLLLFPQLGLGFIDTSFTCHVVGGPHHLGRADAARFTSEPGDRCCNRVENHANCELTRVDLGVAVDVVLMLFLILIAVTLWIAGDICVGQHV